MIHNNQSMKLYNLEHQFDMRNIYNKLIKTNDTTETKEVISKYLSNHYDDMTLEEMKTILHKCISENGMRHILLKYEMKNLYTTKTSVNINLPEYRILAQRVLNRYQSKAGGYAFNDTKWREYDHTAKKHTIYTNEIVYENTISENEIRNSETVEFLQDLLNILNKISGCIKATIHTKYYPRDLMYRVFIKCTQYNQGI